MTPPLPRLFLGLLLSPSAQAFIFEPLPAPDPFEETRAVAASPAYATDGKRHAIGYQTLMRSGERRGDQIFGLLHDRDGNLIHAADGGARISRNPDYSSLIPVGRRLFMLTHFEEIPGAIYLSEVTQTKRNGLLSVDRTRPLDLSAVQGGWNHCAGSTTPWQTHLGTE